MRRKKKEKCPLNGFGNKGDSGNERLKKSLREHIEFLANHLGERHIWNLPSLRAAGKYIAEFMERCALEVRKDRYLVEGVECENIEGTLEGEDPSKPCVVVGAHYDSVAGSPGANDNASGVAALLELVRNLSRCRFPRTVKFVAFTNEEPPHFQTDSMGSLVYARRLKRAGQKLLGMLSLETIGYYRNEKGTQSYPFPFGLWYNSVGNFLAFVSCRKYKLFLKRVLNLFRRMARFPSEGAAVWASLPGVSWSDHWSFWQQGFAAVMVTDTALFRYPYYHTAEDTPEKIDYDRLSEVVEALAGVLARLAR